MKDSLNLGINESVIMKCGFILFLESIESQNRIRKDTYQRNVNIFNRMKLNRQFQNRVQQEKVQTDF